MSRFADVAGAVAWRSITGFLRRPAFLLPALIFPLFFFIAFAGGLSNIGNVPGFDYPGGYTAFQFVFVLLQASALGGVFTGFGIALDFEFGFARRLLLAAPNRVAIVVGYVLAGMFRSTVILALLFAVALAAGMDVTGGPFDVAGLLALGYLVNIAGALFAAGVALRTRTIQAAPMMQMPVFLVIFLAPVYVPLELLAGWVHAVATVNPFTPVIEGGRDLLAGATTEVAGAFAIAAALVVAFSWWAVRGLRRAEAAG